MAQTVAGQAVTARLPMDIEAVLTRMTERCTSPTPERPEDIAACSTPFLLKGELLTHSPPLAEEAAKAGAEAAAGLGRKCDYVPLVRGEQMDTEEADRDTALRDSPEVPPVSNIPRTDGDVPLRGTGARRLLLAQAMARGEWAEDMLAADASLPIRAGESTASLSLHRNLCVAPAQQEEWLFPSDGGLSAAVAGASRMRLEAALSSGAVRPAEVPAPAILVGYQEDWLLTNTAVLRLWDKAPFEPCSAPKAISAIALAPPTLANEAAMLMRELAAVYAACQLGSLTPSSAGAVFDLASTGMATNRGESSVIAAFAAAFSKIAVVAEGMGEGKILAVYICTEPSLLARGLLSEALDRLGTAHCAPGSASLVPVLVPTAALSPFAMAPARLHELAFTTYLQAQRKLPHVAKDEPGSSTASVRFVPYEPLYVLHSAAAAHERVEEPGEEDEQPRQRVHVGYHLVRVGGCGRGGGGDAGAKQELWLAAGWGDAAGWIVHAEAVRVGVEGLGAAQIMRDRDAFTAALARAFSELMECVRESPEAPGAPVAVTRVGPMSAVESDAWAAVDASLRPECLCTLTSEPAGSRTLVGIHTSGAHFVPAPEGSGGAGWMLFVPPTDWCGRAEPALALAHALEVRAIGGGDGDGGAAEAVAHELFALSALAPAGVKLPLHCGVALRLASLLRAVTNSTTNMS
mmetsp:Transcript_29681/g.96676  ORF Transcript_29681/g.96676 Transcript_29681/m.96676 type:complete len:690 (-) Transcript_29681:1433-3502(-)